MYSFRNILVDIDASAMAQPALAWAVALARRTGARLRLVHVMPAMGQPHGFRPDLHEDLVRIRREQLVRLAGAVADTVSGVDVLTGPAVPTLLREVEQRGHDLVVRNHHRDLAARYGGDSTVDIELFRRCPCAVLAVRQGSRPPKFRVAVAVDVDNASPAKQTVAGRLVDVGLAFAQSLNGSLSLINAWQPPGEVRVALHASGADYGEFVAASRCGAVHSLATLADACDAGEISRRLTVRHGPAEDVLPAFVVSEGIDLLVVGSSGRTGLARILQPNTAEHLLERVPCSVVAVRVPAVASFV
jgi:universal stress protein E